MDYLKNAKVRMDEAAELIGRAIGVEKLSTIERDIILDKLAKAYDCLLTGRMPQADAEPARAAAEPRQLAVEQPLETKPHEVVKPVTPAKKAAAERPTPEPPQAPVFVQPKVKEVSREEELPRAEPADHPQGEILAEKFRGKQKFRNEFMAEHTVRVDMSAKLQNKPIVDLAKAIGVNDKFLFTKELFGGDSALYSQTIGVLNSQPDLNGAIIYLQENFQWSESSECAARFIDLVRRKFI